MNEETMPLKTADVSAALGDGAFAWALESGAPLAILAGESLRLLYATSAMLALFEARTIDALDSLIAASQSPGARRLRRLASQSGAFAAPRLEHLRFFARGAPLAVDLIAGRVRAPDGATWLVAAAPARPAAADLAVHEVPAPAERPAVREAEPAPYEPPPLDGPVRFLWALDADDRFTLSGPEVEARLGPNAPRAGEPLAELELRAGLGRPWSRAISTRSTFSGLRLEWWEPSNLRARVVKISGAPAFDAAKAFAGYRGFGVFTGEGVEAPAPLAEVQPVKTTPKTQGRTDESSEDEATGFEPAESPLAPKSGAEIFVLRPGAPAHPTSNVVSIRPAALNQLTSALDGSSPAQTHSAVELTPQEREAFREIARALGARKRDPDFPDRHAPGPGESELEEQAPEPDDLARLIDALPVGLIVLSDGAPQFANRALLDFAGYESFESFRAQAGAATLFEERDPEQAPFEGEDVPVVAAGGERALVHALSVPIGWMGEPATLVTLRRSRDVEHLSRIAAVEAEAHDHARRASDYFAAIDLATDGFVQVDASGRVAMMSPKAEALFGFRPEEGRGGNFLSLIAQQSQAATLAAFLEVVGPESGLRPKVAPDIQLRAADGGSISRRLTFARLRGSAPVEAFFLIANFDGQNAELRDVAAAKAEAARANERKTEFLALVSHEIRTPLQAILGFAEVMMEERFGPIGNERYKEYLKDIHASGRHVISLANDLIDLAKIEAGKLELVFEPVDVNRVIRDCVALMQPQAARERILMRMSLADNLPSVLADSRSLRQIMLNLMSNAIKFNEPGGQVIVSTAPDDVGGAIIRVRDTGVGMSDGELALALEPFRRPEGGKIAEGTGLGLPLTKALVEANHADFLIKSRKEQGTLVEVAFPSMRAAQ